MKATTALLRLYPKALESADSIRAALAKRAAPAPVPNRLRRTNTITTGAILRIPTTELPLLRS